MVGATLCGCPGRPHGAAPTDGVPMKNILLVLTTTCQVDRAVELAIDKAKNEKANLTALFIIDSSVSESIVSKMSDFGFLGDRPSSDLTHAILKEYRDQGNKKLDEVKWLAECLGISCQTFVEEGDYTELALKKITRFNIDYAVVTRCKSSSISSFLFGSAMDRLVNKAGCKVEIVEE